MAEDARPAGSDARRREMHGLIVEALLSSNTLSSQPTRELWLELVHAELRQPLSLRQHSALRPMLVELVRQCAAQPQGLRAIADSIRELEADSEQSRAVDRAVQECEALEPGASHSPAAQPVRPGFTPAAPKPRVEPGPPAPEPAASRPRDVFVVHGRDEQVRRAFWRFLQALDLRPIDWEEHVRRTGSSTPFLGEVVAHAFDHVQAAVVLLTPDDVASLHPDLCDLDDPGYETAPTGQPRPNVLFEAGMAFALRPTRTIVIEIGHLRPFADLGGRNVIRFDGSLEKLQKIVQRLKTAGCAVNDTGDDWLDTSRFTGLSAFTRRP